MDLNGNLKMDIFTYSSHKDNINEESDKVSSFIVFPEKYVLHNKKDMIKINIVYREEEYLIFENKEGYIYKNVIEKIEYVDFIKSNWLNKYIDVNESMQVYDRKKLKEYLKDSLSLIEENLEKNVLETNVWKVDIINQKTCITLKNLLDYTEINIGRVSSNYGSWTDDNNINAEFSNCHEEKDKFISLIDFINNENKDYMIPAISYMIYVNAIQF